MFLSLTELEGWFVFSSALLFNLLALYVLSLAIAEAEFPCCLEALFEVFLFHGGMSAKD